MTLRISTLPSLCLAFAVMLGGACSTIGGDGGQGEVASGPGQGDNEDDPTCGCEEILESCADGNGENPNPDECVPRPECELCDEEGGNSDFCDAECQDNPCQPQPPADEECVEDFLQCVDQCTPPPVDMCDFCDAHLDECLGDGDENGDDPNSDGESQEQCLEQHQICRNECDDDRDPPRPCAPCDDIFEQCAEGSQENGDEEDWFQCQEDWAQCTQECMPPDSDHECYQQFEICLNTCDEDGVGHEQCEMQLQECLSSCGDH